MDIAILAMMIPIRAIKRAKPHQFLIMFGKLKANIEAEITIEKKVVVNWAKDCGFLCWILSVRGRVNIENTVRKRRRRECFLKVCSACVDITLYKRTNVRMKMMIRFMGDSTKKRLDAGFVLLLLLLDLGFVFT